MVAQATKSLQQPEMAYMEEIEGAVGKDADRLWHRHARNGEEIVLTGGVHRSNERRLCMHWSMGRDTDANCTLHAIS
jgi:hypothetical protein